MDLPETRYARSGNVNVAFQVYGVGPVDLVWVPGFVSILDLVWQYPPAARFARRLGTFSRVIAFDKRGTGLSDRVSPDYVPDLETRMDDVRAVMDAAESERAVIFGASEGGPMSILFAATYPDRAIALIAYGASPRFAWAPDYPRGITEEQLEAYLADLPDRWGTREMAAHELANWAAPSVASDPSVVEWFAAFMRMGSSPGSNIALERMNFEIDVRSVLPTIRVPTLIVHREGDRDPTAVGSYMADRIPGSRLVVLPGSDHIPWFGDAEAVLAEIEVFVKSVRDEEADLSRVLATVLFTDIVESTVKATALGDRAWRELLERHHTIVRTLIGRYGGTEVDTAGDGFLTTFDGPARAIRCAQAIRDALRPLGLQVRAGLHTGECETIDGKVGGIAVVIGARVGALARASEVLVSQTVKDLVAGSGLVFEDAGEHELKGVPDGWRLYRVVTESP
jgi:class 3 adenylate cyclase/pimeloyl-ACP methyl ester carboxylesterase